MVQNQSARSVDVLFQVEENGGVYPFPAITAVFDYRL